MLNVWPLRKKVITTLYKALTYRLIFNDQWHFEIYTYKRNARSLPGVINDNAKAKVLYHLYCAFSELLCIVHMLRKLYTKNTE